MPTKMLVFDQRVEPGPPHIAHNTHIVGPNTSTIGIINWVGEYARRQGPLNQLIIICHGLYSHTSFLGLELGDSNLTFIKLAFTRAWNPNIENIIIYACSAASPEFLGLARCGVQFCRAFAGYTGAHVYASDSDQEYESCDSSLCRMNMGAWEGNVYHFSPNGSFVIDRSPPNPGAL